MCGISGCVNVKHAGEAAAHIASNQVARGVSSAGVAYLVQPEKGNSFVQTFKRLESPTKFYDQNKGKLAQMDIFSALGHNRWPSKGSVKLANAHPFRSCDGTFALVHNGSCPIPAGIWKFLEARGHKIQGTPDPTDSEMFMHCIEELLKANNGDRLLALRGFNKVGAQFSILLLFNDGEVWGTRDNWPCVIVQRPGGGTYFASEEYGFKDLIPKDEVVKVMVPGKHSIYRCEANGDMTFWGDFAKEERVLTQVGTLRYIHLGDGDLYSSRACGPVYRQTKMGKDGWPVVYSPYEPVGAPRKKKHKKSEQEVPDLDILKHAASLVPNDKFNLSSKKERKRLRKLIKGNLWLREELNDEMEDNEMWRDLGE